MTVNNLHPRVTEEDIVVSTVSCRTFRLRPLPCQGSPRPPPGLLVRTHRTLHSPVRPQVWYRIQSKIGEGKDSWGKGWGIQVQMSGFLRQMPQRKVVFPINHVVRTA